MTLVDTLFGLVPQTSTGQQWLARDLQLVNWGGYHGHHALRLAPGATLLSGASGSGKSTLMDAYIALLMPHTTPFNGASNGGVVGRPRGKDQRNVLSYARGKVDESRTEDGTRQRVLRGDGQDTWSAIAMTWNDQSGALFTAVRAWYVPAAARTLEDVVAVRATCDDAFDARALEPAAAARFSRAALAAAGLSVYDTDRELTARLHSTLGIGAAGDGAKAVALLGRIQAGQQITTVDALYKSMVLEEPDTLATADAVVEQFDKLSATRDQMVTARQQVRALEPVEAHRAQVDDAQERLAVLDQVGSFDDGTSPAALWRAGRRLDLLRSVEADLQAAHAAARRAADELAPRLSAARAELDGVKETLWAAGGDRLAAAQREAHAAGARVAQVRAARGVLDDAIRGPLGASLTDDEAGWAVLVASAQEALRDGDAKGRRRQALFAAMTEKTSATADLVALRAERESTARRTDNIPSALHEARAALAAAAGLQVTDLPFVGELIEVRTQFEPWREAFNLALGSFATLVLIDAAHLAAFRKAIDGVPTARRLRFQGVPTGLAEQAAPDARTLPGRLDHKGGPFTGWLSGELASRYAYVCVDTPGELGQHPKALTRAGQVSDGQRGAHGGQGAANVLGFTNTRLLADLDARLARASARVASAEAAAADAGSALDAHEGARAAYERILAASWEQLDVVRAAADEARWQQAVADLTEGNPEVGRLQQRAADLDVAIQTFTEDHVRARQLVADLAERWSATSDDVDVTQSALDEASGAALDVAGRAYLDGLLRGTTAALPDQPLSGVWAMNRFADSSTRPDPGAALAAFDAVVARAAETLQADRQAARDQARAARESLRRIFETFVERWPDVNLGTDPDESYGDYLRILADLRTSGLHELESQWRKSLLRLSGNDLTDLHGALSRSVRQIKDRIGPVNDILAELPFADDEHRLRIDARDTASAVVARFRRELRDLRELLSTEADDAERERRYHRTARLVDRLRRTSPDFADLVDVRRHVRLSAEKVDLDGRHVALYDHIGEKSGGESQELVAFIVGAALRYQLGDAGAPRPRYAPVFLDEALIKADARFTGRAVGAWRGLGFQLIIGAPNDKVSALEPHVEAQYVVLKDAAGHSRARAFVGLPDEA